MPAPLARPTAAASLGLAAALLTAACGSSAGGASADVAPKARKVAGTTINLGPEQHRVSTPEVASIAALVPEPIRRRGTLEVVDSAGSAPPLNFYATDDRTVIGVETDIAHLVADVLGLKVHENTGTWEQIFVGLDSGRYDIGFSNITVTEERKEKYDFATYRLDNIAFETRKGSGLKFSGPKDVAGRTIGVSSGTNQEKLLVEWSEQDVHNGLKPVDITYYPKATDYYLPLNSGRIDAWLGPNPSIAYHVAAAGETEIAGTFSGGGASVQGKIAATVRKDNGLVEPVHAALQTVIDNGSYAQVLKRWGLSGEAVTTSEINPPGLPKTNQ
ncbi:ABC transporter substrate-binding protein [Peterkaempfera bronchialis]|uniref:ABC transporter substrate-binding protein n=1 Tax=Peterkaempfera bronchialis TaxID=2126346 RepID=A0A345T0D8_9ACTN|nr:ABC transporter substrate-binding protein [Peterkaempfera bronchialis]AXI79443.1 ABC transporter substrate-binding protein [Peterkaempfera bronchialis]